MTEYENFACGGRRPKGSASAPELRTINAAGQEGQVVTVPCSESSSSATPVPAAPSEGPTPRTDALLAAWPSTLDTAGDALKMQSMVAHARQLERELAWCRKLIQDQANALDHGAVSASGGWHHFDAAYSKACESSQPRDWMQAALLAQQVRNAVSTSGLRPEVIAYATAMQFKLDKNAKKKGWPEQDVHGDRGWKSCSPEFLNSKLVEEVVELQQALEGSDMEAIRNEAADVGNIAMMLADNAGALVSAIGKVSDG